MKNEKHLINLEKEIRAKMMQIKSGKVIPAQSGIGKLINLLKPFDEVLYTQILEQYKQILQNRPQT
jgi:hypothetical protein